MSYSLKAQEEENRESELKRIEIPKQKASRRFRPLLKMGTILQQVYKVIYKKIFYFNNKLKIRNLRKADTLKLHVGCGKVKFPGWVNIDIEPGAADLIIDVRKGLPFDDESVDYIYNEHFIEHLTYEECEKVLQEFWRVLKKGGVLRIATPDLDYIIDRYINNWRDQEWLTWPEYSFIKTRGEMLNISFRWWGHKYLYNEEDLRNQLKKANFKKIVRCEWGKSKHASLCGLETRKDSKLILEAEKE
jgi:predicted SAM-dependent methyltransferase